DPCRGSLDAGVERLAGQGDEGGGAALRRGAFVALALAAGVRLQRGADDLAGDLVEPAAEVEAVGGAGERELLLAAGLAPRTVCALRIHPDGPGPDELGEGTGVHRLGLRDEEALPHVRVGELGPQ